MFEGIKGLFSRKKRIEEIPDGDYGKRDVSLERSSMPPTLGISLDPEEEYKKSKIEDGVAALVISFEKEKGVMPLLEEIAGWVSGVWAKYNNNAQEVILQAIDYLKKTLPAHEGEESTAVDGLRSRVQMTLTCKAGRLAVVQQKLAQAREDLRWLKIGIFGSPERVVVLTNKVADLSFLVASIALSIAIEFFLNFDLIQWAAGRLISASFSLTVGFAASLAAYYAGDAMQKKFAYADALGESGRWSKKVNGVDPVTREKVEKPFELPANLSFQSKLSHSLWIGLCLTVLAIRGFIVYRKGNWGSLSGSIGFIAAVGVYYLVKINGKSAAGADEYLEKEKEVREYEKELETLKDPMAKDQYTGEIMASFLAYKRAVSLERPEGRMKAIAEARDEIIRLRDRSESAEEFFPEALERSVEALCKSIERLHTESVDPSEEEIRKMLTTPDPLAHANPEINQALSETRTIPMTGASVDIYSLIQEAWAKALEEQKRLASEEEHLAALKRADDARKFLSGFRPTKGGK